MTQGASIARASLLLLTWLLTATGCQRDSPLLDPVGPSPRSAPAVLVGAGDIADCGLPGADQTAQLLDLIEGTVIALGDNAYYHGARDEYERCYAANWGRHRHRTRPVPGNHDYETPNADGYFAYFGSAAAAAAPGFYSYEAGTWHVIALNSNIPLDAGSAQLAWLRADLDAHRRSCTLAYMHHPFFSSGVNGPTERLRPMWDLLYAEGADVVVSAHEHLYERFAPQSPDGRADPERGLREFVVGTGGAAVTSIRSPRANSEANASVWGVLKLTLLENEYRWEFVPVPGEAFRDTGAGRCH